MERNENYTASGMANSSKDHRAERQNNGDEREKANTGDWEDQRAPEATDSTSHESETNSNSGGAGSTGSAATNS